MLQWTWECICLFEAVFLCSPNQYSVEPLLGHVVVVFIFSGTSIPFVTVAAPISIPTNSAQCLLVCTPLTPPGVCLWDNCCSNSCEGIADCGFDWCFPDDAQWCRTTFSVCWHLCAIFGQYLFTYSPHFLYSFFLFWFVWVLCVFWILASSHTYDSQIFFSYWVSGLLSFWWFLLPCGRFQFDVVPLVYFCFCCLCIWCPIWRLFAKTNVERLSTCVFLEVYGFRSYVQIIHPLKILCVV